MGRLFTLVAGILIGVVMKWQYDQQQTAPVPATSTQPAGRHATGSHAADVQVISITVEEATQPSAIQTPAYSIENPASPPNAK